MAEKFLFDQVLGACKSYLEENLLAEGTSADDILLRTFSSIESERDAEALITKIEAIEAPGEFENTVNFCINRLRNAIWVLGSTDNPDVRSECLRRCYQSALLVHVPPVAADSLPKERETRLLSALIARRDRKRERIRSFS